MKTIQDSKWWSHFRKFCAKSKLADGAEENFIIELFNSWDDKSDKIFPYVLSTGFAGDVEEALLDSGNYAKKTLTEEEYIKITLRKAVMWARDNHITNNKIGAFLVSPLCITKALRGEYYKPLFMFSVPFIERYGELTEDDVLKKNSIRAFHPEVYDMLKQALGAQFID